MENRGDNKLRSLLRKFELQTPSPAFTEEVLKEIEAMAEDKVYANAKLKAVLRKNISSVPSAEFTYKVLNKVRDQSRADHPPIIGKKTWGLVVLFITVCVIVALVKERSGETATELRYYLPIEGILSELSLRFVEPLLYSGVIIFSAALLLLLDYVIRAKLWNRGIRK